MSLRFRSSRTRMAAAISFVFIGARTAAAQDVTSAVEAPNVAVLGTHITADDARGVDDGQGIRFTIG